ncbi:AI-2E family transporter [Halovivax gelatinilyticus]|uniref:AI-2E family transporter n=1 Tax=Halovivax gelatinilyticus TaxID=2961597 RepID=UPI0020CA41FF|nr:AI-2E family transporter [Halovivax gelatinilyticus]
MKRPGATLLALAGVFAVLSLLLVLPFLQYVLLAVLLAYVLAPLQRRLEGRLSPTIAAGSLVALAVVAFVVPFAIALAVIAEDAVTLAQDVDADTLQLGELESVIADVTGYEVDITEEVSGLGQEAGTFLAEQATTYFAMATHAIIGLGLTLFLLYYLLKDGDSLVSWIREHTPVPSEFQDRLFSEIDDVMRAVLIGHVLIAFVEGLIAGIGLFATGIPNAAFWTVVMMILALIPLVGAFLVWGPAVGYLLLTGEPVLAGALFVYSAIVVGVSDDYLRPLVVDRYAQINPAVIILGVIGGVYAFGVMGLFFGPVVLGALIATVSVLDEYWERQDRRHDDP